jgi:hypothetical protein
VSFHAHKESHCRHVTKCNNKVSPEQKDLGCYDIERSDANSEAEELLKKGPEKGIVVDGLFGAWYDPQSQNICEMEPDIGREIIIEENDRPRSADMPFKRSKSIGRQSKSYITTIFKVFMVIGLAANSDMLALQRMIVFSIENVCGNTLLVFAAMAILHIFCN